MSARLVAAALLPAIGLVATPTTAMAFQAPVTPQPRETDTVADRFGFIDGEQLQITTGTDDDTLTAKIALPAGPAVATRFSLGVSAPLHGGEDAAPASLDALANGTRVTLSFGYFDIAIGDADAVAARIERGATEECLRKDRDPDQCRNTGYAVSTYDPRNAARYQRHQGGGGTDFGLDATVGINDFEWIDPVTFAPQKDRRTDWSVAGHITYYPSGTHTALTASASYQRAYEAVDEQQLCPPNVVDPATQCMTARGAAPRRNENFLLTAGVRHRFFLDGRLQPLAIAPQITYDVIDDVVGVDVPVYFIPGADGGLTGGVRFGYRSDRENEFSVGVFVGAAFNILGG